MMFEDIFGGSVKRGNHPAGVRRSQASPSLATERGEVPNSSKSAMSLFARRIVLEIDDRRFTYHLRAAAPKLNDTNQNELPSAHTQKDLR